MRAKRPHETKICAREGCGKSLGPKNGSSGRYEWGGFDKKKYCNDCTGDMRHAIRVAGVLLSRKEAAYIAGVSQATLTARIGLWQHPLTGLPLADEPRPAK